MNSHNQPTQIGYDHLLREYGNLTEDELQSYKSKDFKSGYPLFNSGVLVVSQEAVLKIRNDAIQISYQLYDQFYKQQIDKEKQMLNKVSYPLWVTEQVALALAVIKNRIPFEILESKFNSGSKNFLPDGSLPKLFHYFKGIYRIDRENLFRADWIQEYLRSNSPTKKALANIINSYSQEFLGFYRT